MEQQESYSYGQLAFIFSNLAKAAEKQTNIEVSSLMKELSTYFSHSIPIKDSYDSESFLSSIKKDIDTLYSEVTKSGEEAGDRGALRCSTWGKKVTSIHKSLLTRFEKQGDALIEGKKVYVCEACGYIAVGEGVPSLCPICKAPSSRFVQIKKGA